LKGCNFGTLSHILGIEKVIEHSAQCFKASVRSRFFQRGEASASFGVRSNLVYKLTSPTQTESAYHNCISCSTTSHTVTVIK